ncbi:MAG TPA: hypothetical protein VNA31_10530 [bacterium]|nr:hypothetical protein [bacterium]
MKAALNAVAFGGHAIPEGDAHALIAAGENLLERVQTAAASAP